MNSGYILGLYGGDNPIDEDRAMDPFHFVSGHDSNASIVRDGVVLAAYEQERLDRIKHSNKAPMLAVRACLEACGRSIGDIQTIAVPILESRLDEMLAGRCATSDYWRTHWGQYRGKGLIQKLLRDQFRVDIPTDRFRFIHHHRAHAALAFYTSGNDEALVLTLDGVGDEVAMEATRIRGSEWQLLRTHGTSHSLGYLYDEITERLGFFFFDEYKVMGMSSYGNPERFRKPFHDVVSFLPEGDFRIDWRKVKQIRRWIPRREYDEYPAQIHMDFAAAGQELFEDIAFHVLRHFQKLTGLRKLCLAGGSALNCVLNGKILASGLFDDVHVPAAAGDSGLSLWAALYAYHHLRPDARPAKKLQQVYLGQSIGAVSPSQPEFFRWNRFVEIRESEDIEREAAALLANGAVIGWMQGASEYGPRALGNRSILADPRSAETRAIINRRIKGREEFRPFGPAVLEDHAGTYFHLRPPRTDYPFMAFTLMVKEECRSQLGAVTHVDGTARVQTVNEAQNPRFYKLIKRFHELTGTAVLLNTSFNNSYEPIVESVEDAIVCFLSSELDYVVVDKVILTKKTPEADDWMGLCPSRPESIKLHESRTSRSRRWILETVRHLGAPSRWAAPTSLYSMSNSYNKYMRQQLSPEVFRLLLACDGHRTIRDLLAETSEGLSDERRQGVLAELKKLWVRRLVRLQPGSTALGKMAFRLRGEAEVASSRDAREQASASNGGSLLVRPTSGRSGGGGRRGR